MTRRSSLVRPRRKSASWFLWLLLGGLFWTTGCMEITASEPPDEYSDFGALSVYTGFEDTLVDYYMNIFRKKYPNILLDIKRMSNGDLAKMVMDQAAQGEPTPDVLWGVTLTNMITLRQQGVLAGYRPSSLRPDHDPRYLDSHDPPYWTGVNAVMSAICINQERLSALGGVTQPLEWADLLSLKYQGHIAMPDPNKTATGYLTLIAWLSSPFDKNRFGTAEQAGWDYVSRLHANIARSGGVPIYTATGHAACDATFDPTQPQVVIGISLGHIASLDLTQAQAQMPPSKLLISYPHNAGYDINTNALINKNKIKPVAKTFLDWAASESMINEYAKDSSATPIPTLVGRPPGLPPNPADLWIAKNDFEWAASDRTELLDTWNQLTSR